MKAVKAAHLGLIEYISGNNLNELKKVRQSKVLEISYTRNSDFNDEVDLEFMNNEISNNLFKQKVEQRDLSKLLNPFLF